MRYMITMDVGGQVRVSVRLLFRFRGTVIDWVGYTVVSSRKSLGLRRMVILLVSWTGLRWGPVWRCRS